MKTIKRAIAIILALSIMAIANVVPVTAASTSFTDVKTTAWYYNYVNKLINLKITAGIGNNKFGPEYSVTKAEFVTFVCKANGLTQSQGYEYTDTKKHWARTWISTAVIANIIDKGTAFNPETAITRQEAVEMLCRSLKLQKDTSMPTPYADVKSNAGYSNTAYKEYLMQGSVTSGKRYFNPSSSLTRAETAAVIVNLVDYKTNAEAYKTSKQQAGYDANAKALASKGIIQVSDDFNPKVNMTTKQYVTFLVRALGVTNSQDYMKSALDMGLISSSVNVNANITRSDMAKLTVKAYERLNTVKYPDYIEAYKTMVTDYKNLSKDDRQNSLKCVSEGLMPMATNGGLSPKDYCTGDLATNVVYSLISAEHRASLKPVFATADKEFEIFMQDYKSAVQVTSWGNYYKIIDGKILWNTYQDGVCMLPTLSNPDSNKEAYETLKTLVGYARKYNHYVEAYYSLGMGTNRLQVFYTTSQKGGQIGDARTQNNFAMLSRFNEDTLKVFSDVGEEGMQKAKTDYYWEMGNLYDAMNINFHRTLEGYQEKELIEPLKAWLNIIYEPKFAEYLLNFILKEDKTRTEYSMKDKKYTHTEVIKPQQFKGLEIQVKGFLIGTNRIN